MSSLESRTLAAGFWKKLIAEATYTKNNLDGPTIPKLKETDLNGYQNKKLQFNQRQFVVHFFEILLNVILMISKKRQSSTPNLLKSLRPQTHRYLAV